MTIAEVLRIVNGDVLTSDADLTREVDSAFGADLMSDVLAFVTENSLLITGLINPHVIRTAEMLDIGCILFSRGKQPSEEMLEMAQDADITILSTKMTTYTVSGELYKHGLPGTNEKTR